MAQVNVTMFAQIGLDICYYVAKIDWISDMMCPIIASHSESSFLFLSMVRFIASLLPEIPFHSKWWSTPSPTPRPPPARIWTKSNSALKRKMKSHIVVGGHSHTLSTTAPTVPALGPSFVPYKIYRTLYGVRHRGCR